MFDRLKRQDEGFTLIELLISIVVSGVILSALTIGFITTMAGSQNVHDRFVESHDAQLLSTYFPADVQSANPTMINTATCPGTAIGDHVIRLQWTESDGTNKTVFSASYRRVASSPGSDLVRYYCRKTGLAALPEQTILDGPGPAATSHIVAHNLSAVTSPSPDLGHLAEGRVALTLYSHQTLSEQRAGIPEYSYTFGATMRTLGAFAPFVVTLTVAGTKAAGAPFGLTITAKMADGSTDMSYTGSKTINFAGALHSPNGAPPTFPLTVQFSNGVSVPDATVTLVNANPTTLNLSQGAHRGSTTAPINVSAGSFSAGSLAFTPCPPPDTTENHTNNALRVTRGMTDSYGNATTTGPAITVGLAQTGGGTISSSVQVLANTATSQTFTSQNPGPGLSVTMTGTRAGYTDATCVFTTTADSPDTTPPPDPTVTTASPANKQVVVTFSDTEAGVTFECQVDGGAFILCTSPQNYGPSNTYNGAHTYGVRAVDAAGNRSGTVTRTQSA